jgi:DNA polymerase III sliding clamp (beta) subunit (PCNA family)
MERIVASFHGDEPAIAFNPHFLLDGITAAAGGAASGRHPGPPAHPEPAHAEPAGTGRAGAAAAGGTGGGEGSPAASATIRLEFTSPARPALITLAGDDGDSAGDGAAASDGAADGDGEAAGEPRPAFRYLVVPLRSPARG